MKLVLNYMRPQSGATAAEVFGIDVAITNFLKAFFRYSRQAEFLFLPGSDDSITGLKDIAAEAQVDFAKCAWINPSAPRETMKDVDLLFRPDPNITDHVWRRLQVQNGGYATCGLVHTMSGERVAGVLAECITAPTGSSDALICPSNAIRDAVRALWDIQSDYFNHRFKTHFTCPVETPVIPLGINTDRFLKITTPDRRAKVRSMLGIADDETVILFVGRLSHVTKAHPYAMMRAAEMAAQNTGKKTRLLMYGYYKPESLEAEYQALAKDACHHVKVDFVMNSDPRFPDGVWAAGDIFTSLVDNIQESFGLTPIEAMACGLPAVISNWDGYRDGVRHGQDGFLIPTIGLEGGSGGEIARHYYNQRNYGDYLLRTNQSVAVDIDMAAAAFALLISEPARRAAMGQSARERALAMYDWRVLIPQYENLWDELAKKRKAEAGAPANWCAVHPNYPDPTSMFASFPSQPLRATDTIVMVGTTEDMEMVLRHRMNIFGFDMLLERDAFFSALALIQVTQGITLTELQKKLHVTDQNRFMRSMAWLIKMGMCRVHNG